MHPHRADLDRPVESPDPENGDSPERLGSDAEGSVVCGASGPARGAEGLPKTEGCLRSDDPVKI